MKKLFILAICFCSAVFYAQDAGEKEAAENLKNIIAAVDSSYSLTYNPAGMDYFIFDHCYPKVKNKKCLRIPYFCFEKKNNQWDSSDASKITKNHTKGFVR